MAKSIKMLLFLGVVLLLIAAFVYQERKAGKLKYKAEMAESYKDSTAMLHGKVASYVAKNKQLQQENNLLSNTNIKLDAKNAALRDSIKQLNVQIYELNSKLKEQSSEIIDNREIVQALLTRSDSLKAVIAQMRASADANQSRIKQLDDERFELDQKIGNLFIINDSLEGKNLKLIEEVVKTEKVKEQVLDKEVTLEIINNTQINFKKLEAQSIKNKKTSRIKKWNHTIIDFGMTHPQMEMIQNESFIIKIINKDTGEYLSPREKTSSNDAQGIPFMFKENPMKPIKFLNYQGKEGKNYAVQIFYVKNGNEYPLRNGNTDIEF